MTTLGWFDPVVGTPYPSRGGSEGSAARAGEGTRPTSELLGEEWRGLFERWGEEDARLATPAGERPAGELRGGWDPSVGWKVSAPADDEGYVDPEDQEDADDLNDYVDSLGDDSPYECGWPIDLVGEPPIGSHRSTSGVRPDFDGLELIGTEWGTDTTQRDFIGTVWAFLKKNTDLADWAMQMAWMTEDARRCVIERIDGERGAPVKLGLKPTPPCRGAMITKSRHKILICSDHLKWQNAFHLWAGPCEGAYQDSRDCSVVAIASSLLHELTHTCGEEHRHGQAIQACSEPYLTGNAFAWAATQRYSGAVDSTCCASFNAGVEPGSDDSFNNVDESPACCSDGDGAGHTMEGPENPSGPMGFVP